MPKLHLRPYPATVALGAVIFALAGAAFLALGRGSQALASHVACGDTITTDMTLDSVHLFFVGDPHGPTTREQWIGAMESANEELGLSGVAVPHVGHVLLEARERNELV